MAGELVQRLMDEVYDRWRKENDMSRLEVCDEFSPIHKAAVQFGNLNYQVCNGGFMQWHDNGYSEDLDDLIEYCTRGVAMGLEHFDTLLKILINVKDLGDPQDYYDTYEERVDCDQCSGTGEESAQCTVCGGTGVEDEEFECDSCGGTGEEFRECTVCDGTGYTTEEVEENGNEVYCNLLRDHNFDSKYYEINENELFESIDKLLASFDDDVDTSNVDLTSGRKPVCKLTGTDGNVFSIIGKVRETLRSAGLRDQAKEFSDKALSSSSYNDVLQLAAEYTDVY